MVRTTTAWSPGSSSDGGDANSAAAAPAVTSTSSARDAGAAGDLLAQPRVAEVVAVAEQQVADVGVDPESASRRSATELSDRLLVIVS